jgi:hypothetical protein
VSTKGSVYGFGGLYMDLPLNPHWYLTPSLAAGLYSHGGGKDLGSPVEFRPQIEGAYEFDNGDRVSLGVSHTSNAGLDSHNPGTQAVTLYYHFPLQRVWGNGGQ